MHPFAGVRLRFPRARWLLAPAANDAGLGCCWRTGVLRRRRRGGGEVVRVATRRGLASLLVRAPGLVTASGDVEPGGAAEARDIAWRALESSSLLLRLGSAPGQASVTFHLRLRSGSAWQQRTRHMRADAACLALHSALHISRARAAAKEGSTADSCTGLPWAGGARGPATLSHPCLIAGQALQGQGARPPRTRAWVTRFAWR